MNPKKLLICATLAALFATRSAQATVYHLVGQNIPPATASGTITTDGTLGVLTAANLVATDIDLSDGTNTATTAGGSFGALGLDLTATASGLFFNFSGTPFGVFFAGDNFLSNFYCIANNAASCGGGTPGSSEVIGLFGTLYNGPVQSGIVQIAAVPEQSTWALMLLGFVGLGFAGYGASRKSVAVAT